MNFAQSEEYNKNGQENPNKKTMDNDGLSADSFRVVPDFKGDYYN